MRQQGASKEYLPAVCTDFPYIRKSDRTPRED